VLVRDTDPSVSLLHQLGVKTSLAFLDTRRQEGRAADGTQVVDSVVVSVVVVSAARTLPATAVARTMPATRQAARPASCRGFLTPRPLRPGIAPMIDRTG
jgi:hypothetical protein